MFHLIYTTKVVQLQLPCDWIKATMKVKIFIYLFICVFIYLFIYQRKAIQIHNPPKHMQQSNFTGWSSQWESKYNMNIVTGCATLCKHICYILYNLICSAQYIFPSVGILTHHAEKILRG